jgi:hypothetical protein
MFCLAFSIMLPAQKSIVGKAFAELICEDTNGSEKVFPQIAKGKFTVIGLAKSKESEELLKTWMNPVYNKFIVSKNSNSKSVFDPSVDYDINLYFIPMFTGLNQLAAKQAKEKIVASTDKQFLPYLLFYKGDNSNNAAIGIEDKSIPYFYVLDKEGKIVYATSGKFEEKKLEQITDILDAN